MTKFGSQFSATDALKKADGRTHDAGMRAFQNHFDLTEDGGTTEALLLAVLPAGARYDHARIEASGNLSTTNLTIGDGTTANKFATTAAMPNANAVIYYPPISLKIDPLTAQTFVYLTPSAALPSTGTIRTSVFASKR